MPRKARSGGKPKSPPVRQAVPDPEGLEKADQETVEKVRVLMEAVTQRRMAVDEALVALFEIRLEELGAQSKALQEECDRLQEKKSS